MTPSNNFSIEILKQISNEFKDQISGYQRDTIQQLERIDRTMRESLKEIKEEASKTRERLDSMERTVDRLNNNQEDNKEFKKNTKDENNALAKRVNELEDHFKRLDGALTVFKTLTGIFGAGTVISVIVNLAQHAGGH